MEVGRRNAGHALGSEAIESLLTAWRDLGSPPIGARVLKAIHNTLQKSLASGAPISPAVIARILADAGAELRHPEVIEFDVAWRAAELERQGQTLAPLTRLMSGEPLRLSDAELLIGKLAEMVTKASDEELRMLAIEARQIAIASAESKAMPEQVRAEQLEIAEWLRIWLETPNVFGQWLELRKSSREFQEKFSRD